MVVVLAWIECGRIGCAIVPGMMRCTRSANDWLVRIQNEDGGWGEDCDSYRLDYAGYEKSASTASQTAWALLGLMAAGEVDSQAVARGIALFAGDAGARMVSGDKSNYTGGGFLRRVLSAAITAIPKFVPLWAVARYRNLKQSRIRAT